jgi:hypothetical protein
MKARSSCPRRTTGISISRGRESVSASTAAAWQRFQDADQQIGADIERRLILRAAKQAVKGGLTLAGAQVTLKVLARPAP